MYTDELATAARNGFDTLWNDMVRSDRKSQEFIHGIQKSLQCCGRERPHDWLDLTAPLNQIPPSCCADGVTTCNEASAFPKGCGNLLFEAVNTSGMLIAWIAIVFGAFEVRFDLPSTSIRKIN